MLGQHRWRWVNATCWLSSECVDKSQTCIDRVKQVCLHVSEPCEGHKFKLFFYFFFGGGGQKSGPAMAGMAGTAPTALLIVPLGWAYAVHVQLSVLSSECPFNPFIPELSIVIFIHYKPRIAVAILDL